MEYRNAIAAAILAASSIFCAMVAQADSRDAAPDPDTGRRGTVFLYGETHGVRMIIDAEYDAWSGHYRNGLRHLFLELPYFTAELLNVWMDAADDAILNEVYADWEGSAMHNPHMLAFFRRIKENCPQTVFHGTDVGHQYFSTGRKYLRYLEKTGLAASEQHRLAREAMSQGEIYYRGDDAVFRENAMVENFVRELGRVAGADVMGIYGSAHTGTESLDHSGKVPCMANQLANGHGVKIVSEDLTHLGKDMATIRIDELRIGGKTYKAAYFGEQDISALKGYVSRQFWRIEGAYGDLKDKAKTGNVLPYNNYPMAVEKGQAFAVDVVKADATVERMIFISDGGVWKGLPATEQIDIR